MKAGTNLTSLKRESPAKYLLQPSSRKSIVKDISKNQTEREGILSGSKTKQTDSTECLLQIASDDVGNGHERMAVAFLDVSDLDTMIRSNNEQSCPVGDPRRKEKSLTSLLSNRLLGEEDRTTNTVTTASSKENQAARKNTDAINRTAIRNVCRLGLKKRSEGKKKDEKITRANGTRKSITGSKQLKLSDCWNKTKNKEIVDVIDILPTINESDNNELFCCRKVQHQTMVDRASSSSSPFEEVGEEKRDFAGIGEGADSTGAPSTSRKVHRLKKKATKKTMLNTDGDSSDQESVPKVRAPTKRTGKVRRKGMKTSTPVTITKWFKKERKVRENEGRKSIARESLERVRKKLDDGINVSLSQSSEGDEGSPSKPVVFESTGSSLREVVENGLLSCQSLDEDLGTNVNESKECDMVSFAVEGGISKISERACPAKYALNSSAG